MLLMPQNCVSDWSGYPATRLGNSGGVRSMSGKRDPSGGNAAARDTPK